jgi:hypothetical protein
MEGIDLYSVDGLARRLLRSNTKQRYNETHRARSNRSFQWLFHSLRLGIDPEPDGDRMTKQSGAA